MFLELFNIIAPVLICTGIGFIWGRLDESYPHEFITRLVMNVGAPSLIVSAINNSTISLANFGQVALVAVIVMVGCGLIALPLARRVEGDSLSMIAPSVFPNCGNMGLPLCLFAFGEYGLTLALGFFLVSLFFHMTLAYPIFMKNRTGGVKAILNNLFSQPVFYAVVASVTMLVSGWRLPVWTANTVDLLGGMTIPAMLITLGVSLSRLKNANWFVSVQFSVLRMGGGFLIALAATSILGMSGTERNVALLQGMMPAAVFNYLLASYFDRSPEITAGIVITSTMMAFIFVPVLLYFLL